MSIRITDNHGPRLSRLAPAAIEPLIRHEVEGGVRLIVEDAQFSIKDGAISGAGHIASLPGEAPNADTHVLDQSIHVGEIVETPGVIRSSAIADAPYAAHLELGTSHMAERPFMAPASRRAHDPIIHSIADRLRKGRA